MPEQLALGLMVSTVSIIIIGTGGSYVAIFESLSKRVRACEYGMKPS